MAVKEFAFSWVDDVFTRLRGEPLDTVMKIRVTDIPRPRDAGMRRIKSQGEGQKPQYVLVLDERLACHVIVCGGWYRVRLFAYQSAQLVQTSEPEGLDRNEAPKGRQEPRSSPLAKHVAENPGPTVGAAALVGALVGASVASKKQRAAAAAAGAGIGAMVGLAMVAVQTANTSPRTSKVAQTLLATLVSADLAKRPASRIIRLKARSRSATTAGKAPKTKPKVQAKKTEQTFDHSVPA